MTSFPNEQDKVGGIDKPWTVPDLTLCSRPAQTGGPTDVCVSHLQQTGKYIIKGLILYNKQQIILR